MTKENWENLVTMRMDLSNKLIHLTKSRTGATGESCKGGEASVFEVFMKIFKEKKICGHEGKAEYQEDTKIVCFQDTPIYAIAQTSHLYRMPDVKVDDALRRYEEGYGFRFDKKNLWDKGVRPTIYLKTRHDENGFNEAEKIVKSEELWRVVNLGFYDENYIIDWSHEREWIYKGDLNFEYEEIEVIVPDSSARKKFIEKCMDDDGPKEALHKIRGILTLDDILN